MSGTNYLPWKNQSIRHDLRRIKALFILIWHKWLNSFTTIPAIPQYDRLHIGCGILIRDGWVNVDLFPRKGAYYVDGNNALPFADSTFQHIHCEHFLEHLEQEQAICFLIECLRILKPDGTLRLIVPDAEKYFRAYTSGDKEFFSKLDKMGGSKDSLKTPCEVINRMFRMWGAHLFAWDYETLSLYMKDIGFTEITLSSPNDVRGEYDIDGNDWWRKIESLYVNATKR